MAASSLPPICWSGPTGNWMGTKLSTYNVPDTAPTPLSVIVIDAVAPAGTVTGLKVPSVAR